MLVSILLSFSPLLVSAIPLASETLAVIPITLSTTSPEIASTIFPITTATTTATVDPINSPTSTAMTAAPSSPSLICPSVLFDDLPTLFCDSLFNVTFVPGTSRTIINNSEGSQGLSYGVSYSGGQTCPELNFQPANENIQRCTAAFNQTSCDAVSKSAPIPQVIFQDEVCLQWTVAAVLNESEFSG